MAAGKIKRFFFSLETAQHQASFERGNDQSGQFRGTYIGTNLSLPLPFFDDRLQMIKPRSESLPGLTAQLRIAIVGIDGRVQERAPSRDQPVALLLKIPQELEQTVHRIRDLVCSLETSIHYQFPGVFEGFFGELLFAIKMTVDSTFFEACRLHEIGEGSAVISSLIKERRCLANDFLSCLLAFSHAYAH